MATQLNKGVRVAGKLRDQIAKDFLKRYQAGESIRAIAGDTGRSYGFVQGILKQAGAEFRSRGGATRGAGQKATGAKKTAGAPKGAAAKKTTAQKAPAKKAAAQS